MPAVTYYVALPFIRTDYGTLAPGGAQECQTRGGAMLRAEAMARISPGAVAFSRTGDRATGEFEDAVVIRQFGEVPSLDDLLSGG